MLAGRDPTTAGFERAQVVQLTLTKVVFACEKPLVMTLRWAFAMTSVLLSWQSLSCYTRMETFG